MRQTSSYVIAIAALTILLTLTAWSSFRNQPVDIEFWYGDRQHFGQLGQPQWWVNILGHVHGHEAVLELNYILNQGKRHALSMQGDLHRLAKDGDFNIEISWDSLKPGRNTVEVEASSSDGLISKAVDVWIDKDKRWPLPYNIDFDTVKHLQNVVQVVDGKWLITNGGVRTEYPYYDRVLTLGDSSWKNYQATLSLTIHGWTPSQPGPPTYNVSHFGVAMRWRGHHRDGRQPSRKWYPLGAQGELLLKNNRDSCQWRILYDAGKEKPQTYAEGFNKIRLDQKTLIKTQIQTIVDRSETRSRYRFKQWLASKPEPTGWDVEGLESDDYTSGALCLVPHNSDVTIHWVKVEEIEN